MIGVVPHLRRQIERDAQPVHPLRQQIAISRVGLRRGAESRVLPHRPQPAPVHRRMDAAREGELARKSERRGGIPPGEILGRARMAFLRLVEVTRWGVLNGHEQCGAVRIVTRLDQRGRRKSLTG